LKTSAEMRLQRISRGAIYKPDSQQLVVPIKHGAEPAEFLVAFLRELIPPIAASETASPRS
jgi:transcription-repair coupling factor (superfamily II helicase)